MAYAAASVCTLQYLPAAASASAAVTAAAASRHAMQGNAYGSDSYSMLLHQKVQQYQVSTCCSILFQQH
jgi:hypothetical protein